MRSRHPPLPSEVRSAYSALRVFGMVLGISGLVLAVVCAANGFWPGAAWSAGTGVLFAILTWVPPTSRWLLPGMVLLGLGISLSLRSWLMAAALLAIVGWSAWAQRRPGRFPEKFEVTEPDIVMSNAEEFVEAFRSLGFEQVGGYQAKLGRVPVVVSLLMSPDGISYASVTDAVLNVTSLFPHGRRLLTRNHNVVGLPAETLINPVPGAEPGELAAGHLRALETLAEHGHLPLDLIRDDLPQVAIESELQAIEWMKGKSRAPRSSDKRALWERPDRAERIVGWQTGQS